jgi:sulfate permease family protein
MGARPAVSQFVPIIRWLPGCSWKSARTDILAGIALAGLLIPEGMAYAGIAGVPLQMGLYSALVGMFVYALFGTSRQLAVTSTSSSAAMLASLVLIPTLPELLIQFVICSTEVVFYNIWRDACSGESILRSPHSAGKCSHEPVHEAPDCPTRPE